MCQLLPKSIGLNGPSDAKTVAPGVDAARRHRDRVFCPNKIIAKLAIPNVAQNCSLAQARPGSDLRRLEKLFYANQRINQVEKLRPRPVGERTFDLFTRLSS